MTRNSDLDCDDLRGCDHSPETPISEGAEIIKWVCRCGEYEFRVDLARDYAVGWPPGDLTEIVGHTSPKKRKKLDK